MTAVLLVRQINNSLYIWKEKTNKNPNNRLNINMKCMYVRKNNVVK